MRKSSNQLLVQQRGVGPKRSWRPEWSPVDATIVSSQAVWPLDCLLQTAAVFEAYHMTFNMTQCLQGRPREFAIFVADRPGSAAHRR